MPKLSPITAKIRAKKLIKDLQVVNGNQSALARKQGRSRAAVSQQLSKPYVRQYMGDVLESAGVTDKVLAKKIKEGLNAEKLVYVENGDSEDGGKIQEHDIDFAVRHKYVETALKLKDHLSPDTKEPPKTLSGLLNGIDPETLGAISVFVRIERIESVLKNQLPKRH